MLDTFTYEDYYKLYRAYRVCLYIEEYKDETTISSSALGLSNISIDFIYSLIKRWKKENITLFERVQKDYFNNKMKRYRCNKRIQYMLNKDIQHCYFMTLTFNKDTFEKLNADSRKQYVRRYLSKYFTDYVANIDFGEHELEHYHAIGIVKDTAILVPSKKRGRFNLKGFEKGFTDAEQVRDCEDYVKLSHYINKFTNHAFKKAIKLIYSRSFKDFDTKLSILEEEFNDIHINDIRSISDYQDYLRKRQRKSEQIRELKLKANKGI